MTKFSRVTRGERGISTDGHAPITWSLGCGDTASPKMFVNLLPKRLYSLIRSNLVPNVIRLSMGHQCPIAMGGAAASPKCLGPHTYAHIWFDIERLNSAW